MTTPQLIPSQTHPPLGRYDRWLSVTKPTATTRFFRTFLLWQLVRFAVINLKMLRIIAMGHHQKG